MTRNDFIKGTISGRRVGDAQKIEELTRKLYVDETGAWSKAYLADLKPYFERVGATVIIIDFNNLKETNDTFGHKAGDERLKACITDLLTELRVSDMVFRTGGDEFVVMLSLAAMDYMPTILDRLHILHNFSFGTAMCPPGESIDTAIERADKQMYEQKQLFKAQNKVVLAPPEVRDVRISGVPGGQARVLYTLRYHSVYPAVDARVSLTFPDKAVALNWVAVALGPAAKPEIINEDFFNENG